MEASAIHLRAAGERRGPHGLVWLRLRSDEQLLALFRGGNDEAFRVLHDRYRQRLFAYVRQMLTGGSRQDAEDVLQDVFVRAYGALRTDAREMNVRAWLYRVAHNRCVDHLRRPVPPAIELFEVSRKPLHDPVEEAQRRDDLRRLVEDVGRLPEQQRSALLMREIDGMSYAELASALDVTVPAIKSLLVRARVGLVEAIEARDADCSEIRADLLRSYDRGVKASGRARRHMRSCHGCREYRVALRGVRRSFAALAPAGAGPLAMLAKLAGLGGASGGGSAVGGGGAATGAAVGGAGAALSGSAAMSGGGLAVGGGLATATACKVAAVVCATALAGGAVEVKREIAHHPARSHKPVAHHAAAAAPVVTAPPLHPRQVFVKPLVVHRTAAAAPAKRAHKPRVRLQAVAQPSPTPVATATPSPTDISAQTGGALAPAASPAGTATPVATITPVAPPPVAPPLSGAPQDGAPPAVAGSVTDDPTAVTGAAAAPPAATPTPTPGR